MTEEGFVKEFGRRGQKDHTRLWSMKNGEMEGAEGRGERRGSKDHKPFEKKGQKACGGG